MNMIVALRSSNVKLVSLPPSSYGLNGKHLLSAIDLAQSPRANEMSPACVDYGAPEFCGLDGSRR